MTHHETMDKLSGLVNDWKKWRTEIDKAKLSKYPTICETPLLGIESEIFDTLMASEPLNKTTYIRILLSSHG